MKEEQKKCCCIYDLYSTGICRVYDIERGKDPVLHCSFRIPPAVILKDKVHSNLKCSLFNPEEPDFSSVFEYKDGDYPVFTYHNENLLTLPEIMYSFFYDIENEKPYEEAKKYFEALKKWVEGKLKEKNLHCGFSILLVPDSLPIESQEKILTCFGEQNTHLLWRSVAIVLGSEDSISFVSDSDTIAVLDRFAIGMLYSKIETRRENGRIIPCHKL